LNRVLKYRVNKLENVFRVANGIRTSLFLLSLLPLGLINLVNAQSDTLPEFEKSVTIQTPNNTFKTQQIDSIHLERLQGKSLGELLQQQTSTFIKSYGMGGIASLSLRGGGASHTQVYWNGMLINSPTLGQADLSLLPVAFVDEVSIHSGSSSTIDGSGGIGGSVQLNSNPQAFTYFGFTKELGSYGIDKLNLKANIHKKRFTSKTVIFKHEATNDFTYQDYAQIGKPLVKRKNASTSSYGIAQDLDIDLERILIQAKVSFVDFDRNVPSAIGVATQKQNQQDQSTKTMLSIRNKSYKNRMTAKLGWINDVLRYENRSTDLLSIVKTTTWMAQLQNKMILKKKWYWRNQVNQYLITAQSSGFPEGKTQMRTALFSEIVKKWKRFDLSVSLREELIDFKTTPLIPTVGVKYGIVKGHEFYFNATQNYHFPTLNDLYWNPGGNPDLLPEQAFQTEVGYKLKTQTKIELTSTLFYSQTKNWILWSPTVNGYWSPQNIKTVAKKGIELNTSKKWNLQSTRNFSTFVNYQYVQATNLESYQNNEETVGKDLIYTPRQILNVSGVLDLKKWTISYQQTWTSTFYINRANTTYMPYSAPANVNVAYRFTEKNVALQVGLGVYNIYNEAYQLIANQPLPGRYFGITLKMKFTE